MRWRIAILSHMFVRSYPVTPVVRAGGGSTAKIIGAHHRFRRAAMVAAASSSLMVAVQAVVGRMAAA